MTIPKQWIDLAKGLVRTGVPVGVAALIAWLRARGWTWIPGWGGTYLIPVVSGIGYWLLVRLGELKLSPKWGVFLLAVGGPVYEAASAALDPDTEPLLLEVEKGSEISSVEVSYMVEEPAVLFSPGEMVSVPPPYVAPVDRSVSELGGFDVDRFRADYEP